MFFWLKKLIGYWIMPVPFLAALFVIGVVLLLMRHRARAGRVLVISATALLLLLSNKAVSVWLVRPLEMRYPGIPELTAGAVPRELAGCQFVVILGGGNGATPGLAALNQLSTSARARIAEGVRLLRVLPRAEMLVSGPANPGYPSHATMLERSALSLGVSPDRIRRIEHARDTEDEALAVKNIAGDTRVAVVTSAWHMPRAIALFRAAGVNALPCPTDYTSHFDGLQWRDVLWDVESLERSSVAVRERIGYLWITLRGKTTP